MPLDYITIPRSEYLALVREVKRGAEVCDGIGDFRVALQALANSLAARAVAPAIRKALDRAVESCEEVARLRVELVALERRLREFDQELTPVRPPSRTDIEAAFQNSVDFAQGKRRPKAE